MKRTSDDLDIYAGTTRSFEWYWNSDDEMLGRDAFEELDEADQDAILATLKYWGDLERGKHIAKSRVNEEHDDPKILAIKAGKHRLPSFTPAPTSGSHATTTRNKNRNWTRSEKRLFDERSRPWTTIFDERNEVSTMNATEARRARQAQGKRSMYDRLREDTQRAARIDRYLEELRLEQQFIDAMEQQHISAAELARRVDRKPASISRDLSGGLSTAKLGRVREMADAVGYDVVALLVPRDPVERKKAIGRVAKELVE